MPQFKDVDNIRESLEEREFSILCDIATKARNSKGRKTEEEESSIRTCFQRDRDRILHSKAFRRLKHKTQVFLSPFDDHFRTRLTHTLEVSQIARTISRSLCLNEDLTEAIALGHDLGHTPFGHCGEGVLNELVEGGFHHNIQSVRVVDVLENLNLCQETVDGILTHTWGYVPKTPEAQVVQLADKIAYINHDIEDSIRAGIISESDLPKDCINYFSSVQSKRLNKMIMEVVSNSLGKDKISMDDVDSSIDRVIAGVEKKSKVMTDKDKELTSYHEVGHALIDKLLPDANELHKVSIIPRGMALGVTWTRPKDESVHVSKAKLLAKIAVSLGGRAAEEIVYGKNEISTGASQDLINVTDMARKMVTAWGMSEKLGPMAYGKNRENVFMGRDFGHQRDYSEQVAYEIDEEIKSIVDERYELAKKLLTENRDMLEAISKELLDKETIDEKEFEEIMERVKNSRGLS